MSEDNEQDLSMPTAVRQLRRRNLFFGGLILLCGMVMGSVVTAVVFNRGPHFGMPNPGHLPGLIAQDMQRKYGLTDEQREKLQAVFEEHGKKLESLWSETQPRVEAVHEAMQKSVEGVLTPEQAKKWRSEFENMRKPWLPRNGGGPGGMRPPMPPPGMMPGMPPHGPDDGQQGPGRGPGQGPDHGPDGPGHGPGPGAFEEPGRGR